MSNGTVPDWSDRKKKREAILRVLKHMVANPPAGQNCIGNDAEAHKLFQDPNIGNITIPAGGRAVVFAFGEKALEAGNSVIIEIPSPTISANPSDRELLSYLLGNYVHW